MQPFGDRSVEYLKRQQIRCAERAEGKGDTMEFIDAGDVVASLSELLRRVERGDEFVVTVEGEPMARLVAFRPDRSGGQWRGKVRLGEDFEDPLPGDLFDSPREPA